MEIIRVGLCLLIRNIVEQQTKTNSLTLGNLYERLMCMLVKPAEQYQSYDLVINNEIFHQHQIITLLKHASNYLLVDLRSDEIASFVHTSKAQKAGC
jgi:hypothetical protein